MRVLNYWPLAFLILIPVIIVMYLLKQKAVDHSFSSLYLWKETYRNMEADTPWEKLKKNWLMLLQILLVLLMVFTLMAPYLKTGGSGKPNIVLIIDNSASMNILMEDNETRLQAALEEAQDYINDLPFGSGITILTSAAEAKLVLTECNEKSQALYKLKQIQGTNLEGDAKPAVELVRSMQNQWESSEIVLFTDTYSDMGDLNGYIVRMDSIVDNATVEYLSYTKTDSGLKVLVRIYNHGRTQMTSDVNLYGDDTLMAVKEVTVEPDSSNVVYFDTISFSGNSLTAELNMSDGLMTDNTYQTVISEDKECKVLLVTYANVYLEKAISLIDGVSITKTDSVEDFSSLESENFDFYIFDGMVPETLPTNGSVMLIGCGYKDIAEVKEGLANCIVTAIESPVTKYAETTNFAVSGLMTLNVPLWADSFLETEQGSVGFLGSLDGQTICVLGFDLHNSDFPLKTEFPVLIYNIVNECASTGMLSARAIETGKTMRINGKNNGDLPVLIFPDGKTKEEQNLLTQETETEQIGIYTVTQETTDGKLTESFAVHFPIAESGGSFEQPDENFENTAPTEVATTAGGAKDLTPYLVGLILLFLAVEWIVYLKRY